MILASTSIRTFMWFILMASLAGCSSFSSHASITIEPDLTYQPTAEATQFWPVTAPLPAPDGLRPCCAFGYDLQTQLLGIPIPFYEVANIVGIDGLGTHRYNDTMLNTVAQLMGLSGENNGIVYTRHGGFIDLAHVRDTADATFFIFSQILPRLGQDTQLDLTEELALRRIKLKAFVPPASFTERYTLAVYMAADVAFQLAAWHEIAQWYGYRSVPGFSEGVSAFSPEDLYSNLLGARLAITLLLQGHGSTKAQFEQAMQTLLPTALSRLGVVSPAETRYQLHAVDGRWWDSHQRIPEKFLVLKRDYFTGQPRQPNRPVTEHAAAMPLSLPSQIMGIDYSLLIELQLWPGEDMASLPMPAPYYTATDFLALAQEAQRQDQKALEQRKK